MFFIAPMSEIGGIKLDIIPRAVAEDFWRSTYGVPWFVHHEHRTASMYSLLMQLKPDRADPQEQSTQRLLLRARSRDRFERGGPPVCQVSTQIATTKNGTKEDADKTIWYTLY